MEVMIVTNQVLGASRVTVFHANSDDLAHASKGVSNSSLAHYILLKQKTKAPPSPRENGQETAGLIASKLGRSRGKTTGRT